MVCLCVETMTQKGSKRHCSEIKGKQMSLSTIQHAICFTRQLSLSKEQVLSQLLNPLLYETKTTVYWKVSCSKLSS